MYDQQYAQQATRQPPPKRPSVPTPKVPTSVETPLVIPGRQTKPSNNKPRYSAPSNYHTPSTNAAPRATNLSIRPSAENQGYNQKNNYGNPSYPTPGANTQSYQNPSQNQNTDSSPEGSGTHGSSNFVTPSSQSYQSMEGYSSASGTQITQSSASGYKPMPSHQTAPSYPSNQSYQPSQNKQHNQAHNQAQAYKLAPTGRPDQAYKSTATSSYQSNMQPVQGYTYTPPYQSAATPRAPYQSAAASYQPRARTSQSAQGYQPDAYQAPRPVPFQSAPRLPTSQFPAQPAAFPVHPDRQRQSNNSNKGNKSKRGGNRR